jgi:hypothetical protein
MIFGGRKSEKQVFPVGQGKVIVEKKGLKEV